MAVRRDACRRRYRGGSGGSPENADSAGRAGGPRLSGGPQMAAEPGRRSVLCQILLHLRLHPRGQYRPHRGRRDGIHRKPLYAPLPLSPGQRENRGGGASLCERRPAGPKSHEGPSVNPHVGFLPPRPDGTPEPLGMPAARKGLPVLLPGNRGSGADKKGPESGPGPLLRGA